LFLVFGFLPFEMVGNREFFLIYFKGVVSGGRILYLFWANSLQLFTTHRSHQLFL
jgi:hypothetical protein